MAKQSAGILLYRRVTGEVQIFLVHPGGPFFKNKDTGAWSIPKGEFPDTEDPLVAAKREFLEETGQPVDGEFNSIGSAILKSGKTVHAWSVEGDIDHETIRSNTFEMEWPPKSGKKQAFPEIDRAGWFNLSEARAKINQGQVKLIDNFSKLL
jgi:predicted NUDIX family NTP pyrophosphohydrolase